MGIIIAIISLILYITILLIDRKTITKEELKKRIFLFNHGLY